MSNCLFDRLLTNDGVLVVGSGSLTHNLAEFRSHRGVDEPCVAAFAVWVREAVSAGDAVRLRRTLTDAPHAARAHASTEHSWPMLVAAGAVPTQWAWRVIDGGFDHGALATDAFVFAAAAA